MKRLIILLLLSSYLLCVTELNQLLRIPVLIEHFLEHKEQNQTISFFKYLAIHYTGEDIEDNDEQRDKQLPFKSNQSQLLLINEFIPAGNSNLIAFIISIDQEVNSLYQSPDLGSAHLSNIWQPPKYC